LIVKIHKCKDEELEKDLREACYFFALHLLSYQMIKNISVDIHVKRKLQDLGNCSILCFNCWDKPRDFEICIKKSKNKDKMIKTLAHEFVHLKQFAKLELNEENNKWKKTFVDTDAVSYHDLPWEVEAACLEEILFQHYKRYKYSNEERKQ
jgi:hypothetical protein